MQLLISLDARQVCTLLSCQGGGQPRPQTLRRTAQIATTTQNHTKPPAHSWDLYSNTEFDDTRSRFSPHTSRMTSHGGHRLCVLKLQICACIHVHRLCWRSRCLCTHMSTCTVPLVCHAHVWEPCCALIGPVVFKVILKWHMGSFLLSPTHILMCFVLIFWPAGFPSLPSLRSQLMVHY